MKRFLAVVVVLAAVTAAGEVPAAAGERARRFTRCCLALEIPGVPPGPVCAQVRGRGPLGPRRACRLLGGRPIGRGDCSLAACLVPPA
jgi:hypothetical protein